MKLIPIAIKKIGSALFIICFVFLLLFSHRHHPPLVIQFLSLLTKQRNAIQCDGDHLIWWTVCVWLQILFSSPHLSMWKLCKRRYWTTANKIAAMIRRRVWEEQQDCCIYRVLFASLRKKSYLSSFNSRKINYWKCF